MMKFRTVIDFIQFAPPIGSILWGIPYFVRLFGTTEREVALWGFVFDWYWFRDDPLTGNPRWDEYVARPRLGLGVGYLGIVLLQLLPIQLWWQFHGRGIGDGTPPSTFVAHWLWAGPHVLLLCAGLLAMGVTLGKDRSLGQPR